MFKVSNEDVKFEQGFVLTIESWENDGDHFATISKNFKVLFDLKMTLKILLKFNKNWGNAHNDGYAPVGKNKQPFDISEYEDEELVFILNMMCAGADNEVEELGKLLRIISDPDSNPDQYDELSDEVFDALVDLSGTHMGFSEDYVVRVLNGWAIHSIPQPVVFKVLESGKR